MVENPYIPSIDLSGPGQRLRSAVQEVGAPMFEGGPVRTSIPHAEASAKFYDPANVIAVDYGAFYGLLDVSGDTYLQGGTVTAGNNTITVDNIKVIDGTTGIEGTVDHHLYLECTGNGVLEDDVLVPGWNLTAVVQPPVSAATVPDNTLPTAASATAKKVYISLGVYTTDGFAPARVGNIQISFCPGNYTVSRS